MFELHSGETPPPATDIQKRSNGDAAEAYGSMNADMPKSTGRSLLKRAIITLVVVSLSALGLYTLVTRSSEDRSDCQPSAKELS